MSPETSPREGTADPGAADDALARAARTGDRAALEQLLHAHTDRIHAVCRRIVGHPRMHSTEPKAMIAIARGITRFDGHSKISTWIYHVATNAALDEVRRQRRRPVPADLPETIAAAGDITGPRSTLASTLTPRSPPCPTSTRAAVVLRDLCDLDSAEIAEILASLPEPCAHVSPTGAPHSKPLSGNPAPDPERLSETT